MSSISRRRNGLMALSVIGGSCLCGRIKAPQSQDRTPASATSPVATNYRESGLVPCPLRGLAGGLGAGGVGRKTTFAPDSAFSWPMPSFRFGNWHRGGVTRCTHLTSPIAASAGARQAAPHGATTALSRSGGPKEADRSLPPLIQET